MIKYPYIAPGRVIKFVPISNKWMQEAKKMADSETRCSWWPTGAVVVKNGKIIGRGSNPGEITIPCPRWVKKCPTGTGYELCNNVCKRIGYGHSEVTSIEDAEKNHQDTRGADFYLYGHWWCCEPCWNKMINAGIKNVYLLKNAHKIFTHEKRSNLMAELARKKKNGQKIGLQDIIWKN